VDTEAGPSKKVRTLEKGKAKESEPEDEEEEHTGPSATEQLLTEILEEQRLHNKKILAEISQIRGALFQVTKHLKYLVNNTNDIADHLMSDDDEDGRRIIGEGKVKKAAGGKVTGGNKKKKEERKDKEVEVENGNEKEKEMEVVVEKETGPMKPSNDLCLNNNNFFSFYFIYQIKLFLLSIV